MTRREKRAVFLVSKHPMLSRRHQLSIDELEQQQMPLRVHVWTTPRRELSDVFTALVGGHVSGLSMRSV
jgi:hypothetical protein